MNIVFLLDNSWSMLNNIGSYRSALNSVVNIWRTDYPHSTVAMLKFNDKVHYMCPPIPIQEVPAITGVAWHPNGLTALYDAICSTIQNLPKENSPYTIIVLSDGLDNNSKNNTTQTIELIQAAKAHHWKFIFLGATEPSIAIAKTLGFDVCILYSSSSTSITRAMQTLSGSINMSNAVYDVRDLTNFLDDLKL